MFHLVTREDWSQQSGQAEYLPAAFTNDGFIHCTDGEENVIAVGNRYYTADPRSYICLVLDPVLIKAPVKYEDPARIYPHIYGPLNLNAVIGYRVVVRDDEGVFLRLEPETADT
ncbi:MAG TPA: DUF952 domain-containing protein [Thermomicrobiales bacterium]|nr:DUF952 domain-containing protein [Thermomicrobiales bacterium]